MSCSLGAEGHMLHLSRHLSPERPPMLPTPMRHVTQKRVKLFPSQVIRRIFPSWGANTCSHVLVILLMTALICLSVPGSLDSGHYAGKYMLNLSYVAYDQSLWRIPLHTFFKISQKLVMLKTCIPLECPVCNFRVKKKKNIHKSAWISCVDLCP